MGITPLVAGALIGGVGAVGSAAIGASSAGDAANAQVQAANTAAQTQLTMYNQTRQDLMPWMTTGNAANTQLANLYGLGTGGNGVPNTAAMTTALENTPGYQFTLGQGTQALDRSAASQGLLLSGGQLKATQAYGQGLAETNAWAPYLAQLNAMSTAGQNSAAKTGDIGSIAAANAGSAQLAGGTAAANGYLGASTAINSGISGATSALQALYGSSYGNPGYGVNPSDVAALQGMYQPNLNANLPTI